MPLNNNKQKKSNFSFSFRRRFCSIAARERGRCFSQANKKLNLRFAVFIKEKWRELRQLGRFIFSHCLNRFWGGNETESPLSYSDVDLRVSAFTVVGCRSFFYSFYLPVCQFSPIQKATLSPHYPKPAGCLISCAPPRPFHSAGLLLSLIQAAKSTGRYFSASGRGFCVFFFPFSFCLKMKLCL